MDKKQIGLIIGAVVNGALLVHALVLTSYLKTIDTAINQNLQNTDALYNAQVELKDKNAVLNTILQTTGQTNDAVAQSVDRSGKILALIQSIEQQQITNKNLNDDMVSYTGRSVDSLQKTNNALKDASDKINQLKSYLTELLAIIKSDKQSLAAVRDSAQKMDQNTP